MEIPAIVLAASVAQGLPATTALVAWRRLNRGRAWIMVWSICNLLVTWIERTLAYRGSNLWFSYIEAPVEGALILIALAQWHKRLVLRRALLIAVPATLVVHLIVVLAIESTGTFSKLALPLWGLLALIAALVTLVVNASDTTEPVVTQDWFWVSAGLALYRGTTVMLMPLARVLIGNDLRLLSRAFMLNAGIALVAYCAVAIGMLCPAQPQGAITTV